MAQNLMKKSTFNDAIFKKKNVTQSIVGKKKQAKKNIFEGDSDE